MPWHQDQPLPRGSLPLPGVPAATVQPVLPAGAVWPRIAALHEAVATEVARHAAAGAGPTVVSGDCLVAAGVLAGLQRAGLEPAVVWFDAHGDLHTTATSTSGYLGGLSLRLLLGGDPGLLAGPLGLRAVAEHDAVLVDARDLDPAEADHLAASAVRRLDVDEVDGDLLPGRPLLLHVDVDVIDPGELPGLLFPAPGGPGRGAVLAAVRRLLATGRVAALDLACPWQPGPPADQAVHAELLRDLLRP